MREFGKISARIWRSKKFRALPDDLSQLVYIYLQTCAHGNSAGCFHISPVMIASEMKQEPAQIDAALDRCAEVGLIRRFEEEDLVQIVAFFDHNAPSSRPQLAGPVKILAALPECEAVSCAQIELAVAIYLRAKDFDKEDARLAFWDQAQRLLSSGDNLSKIGHSISLSIGLSRDLASDLLISHPSLLRTEIQTETQTETERETETQSATESVGEIIEGLARKAGR